MKTEQRSYLESRIKNEGRKITILAAKFNSLSKKINGQFSEMIAPGAFDGADMSDVVACLNHNKDILYARTASNTLKLKVTSDGLMAEFEAPATSAGNNLLVLVKRGDISKASFEFVVDKDSWFKDPVLGDVRTITKFRKITDVSPVVFPAYGSTDVASRQKPKLESIHPDVIHAEVEFHLMKLRQAYK